MSLYFVFVWRGFRDKTVHRTRSGGSYPPPSAELGSDHGDHTALVSSIDDHHDTTPATTMRLELFGKDTTSLRVEARSLVGYGALGLNVPHKSKDSPPLATLRALQDVLPPEVLRECVPHYSLKFAYDRSADVTRQSFVRFCTEAAALPTPPRQLLLVSGSGQRKFDTVQCLKSLPQEHSDAIGIGVAFNPYIPDRAQRERERARLRLKVGTGRVSAIWLQLGSDLELLADGLKFLETLAAERRGAAVPLRLYGSIFVPSRQLLARMKFRPWNGVYLSES